MIQRFGLMCCSVSSTKVGVALKPRAKNDLATVANHASCEEQKTVSNTWLPKDTFATAFFEVVEIDTKEVK